jgi:osmotically inducible protein OsmC
MDIVKTANATWKGGLKDGKGVLTTQSGALSEQPYGFNTRFEDKEGTNPEELVGASLAGCFVMAFSKELGEKDFKIDLLKAEAKVHLKKGDGGFSVPTIDLEVNGQIPDMDQSEFEKMANTVKENCPISKLMNAEVKLTAKVNA